MIQSDVRDVTYSKASSLPKLDGSKLLAASVPEAKADHVSSHQASPPLYQPLPLGSDFPVHYFNSSFSEVGVSEKELKTSSTQVLSKRLGGDYAQAQAEFNSLLDYMTSQGGRTNRPTNNQEASWSIITSGIRGESIAGLPTYYDGHRFRGYGVCAEQADWMAQRMAQTDLFTDMSLVQGNLRYGRVGPLVTRPHVWAEGTLRDGTKVYIDPWTGTFGTEAPGENGEVKMSYPVGQYAQAMHR